jgi:hypothetical protein
MSMDCRSAPGAAASITTGASGVPHLSSMKSVLAPPPAAP